MLGYPPLGCAHDTANQRGLAPATLGQLEETGRRWHSREGSRHPSASSSDPSGVRVVLKNGQGAAWARKTASVHDIQTERLWDKVLLGNLAKIMEI